MENASQEYIAATIMHELIHAYMGAYMGIVRNNDTQHPLMVGTYAVQHMAGSLESLFPGLSHEHAMAMAWQGLDTTPTWILSMSMGEKFVIQNINDQYKNHALGTPCP